MSNRTLQYRAAVLFTVATGVSCLFLIPSLVSLAAEPTISTLKAAFEGEVRPILERYCFDCHGGSGLVEGEVNLAAMQNWDEAAKHTKTWEKVAEMLGNGLMPPADAEQPTEAERSKL